MAAGRRRVAWTESARNEFDEAVAFVAEDSPQAALELLERILRGADSLSSLSERGRVVPERRDPAIREILVDPYRLIYGVDERGVVILGLLHQRRDFERWDRTPGT